MDVSLLTNKWFSNYQKMYFSNKIVATTKLQSWEKKEHVCFSRVCLSVILLTGGRGFPCDHYPWCIERQIQGPPRHIQTCLTCLTSLWRDPLFSALYAPPHWNLFIMKHVWLASGQLASNWNAGMFFFVLLKCLLRGDMNYIGRYLWFVSGATPARLLENCRDSFKCLDNQ